MEHKQKDKPLSELPDVAAQYLKLIIRKMRYRRKTREEVAEELADHFLEAIDGCKTNDEKDKRAKELIADFGDAKLLGILLRRAKKRCRPLWRIIIARTFQTIGVLLVLLILYIAWFLSGRAVVSQDYLAQLNRMGRPGVSDEDNAWPFCEEAIRLYAAPDKTVQKIVSFGNYNTAGFQGLGGLDMEERAAVEDWVLKNDKAWRKFVSGSVKRYCHKHIEYNSRDEQRWLLNILATHFKGLRNLTMMGVWRASIAAERGKSRSALEDCLAIARTGRLWQNGVPLMDQLVGMGMSRTAHSEMLRIVAGENLDETELAWFFGQLKGLYPAGYPHIGLKGYKTSFLDTVQHLFTDTGPGGGHLLPGKMRQIDALCKPVYRAARQLENLLSIAYGQVLFEKGALTAIALTHARRDETLAAMDAICDELDELVKLSPYQRQRSRIGLGSVVRDLPKYRDLLIHIFAPDTVVRAADRAYRLRAMHEALLTVVALQRWKRQEAALPQELAELVRAGYLKKLPMDPYSDNPLSYRKTEDGFVLYSFGENMKDDGGEVVRDKKGKIRKWAGEGDWVFWPAEDD